MCFSQEGVGWLPGEENASFANVGIAGTRRGLGVYSAFLERLSRNPTRNFQDH